MSKYTEDDKLSAVQSYLNGIGSYASIGAAIGTTKEVIRNWVKLYKHHGLDAFKKSYTTYSAEFKLDVLNYMNEHGTSPNETAAIFNITSPALIRKWRKQFKKEGIDALELKKKGRPGMKKETKKSKPVDGSIEALQAELDRLRMENAYLKKLNSLVQNKEKLRSKTKQK